jgi:uncharacterized protein YigE (DUF2233 family)
MDPAVKPWKFGWIFSYLLILLITCFQFASAASWRELSPGIEYLDLEQYQVTPWSHIHAFKINIARYPLSLVMAKDLDSQYASAEEFAKHSQALIAINGGFFDSRARSLGLRISKKQIESPIKAISWWGIFYIKQQKPYLTTINDFSLKGVDFAIQSGPRLLIDGDIPSLKPGSAERSALCITENQRVIILVTDHTPLSTTALAQLLKKEPFNCFQALNLDGGSSSQLFAQIANFNLNVHGIAHISDAVVVGAKKPT